jgi:hypothetical protein
MMVEVSIGEVIDKYTILQIKLEKIKDISKLKNIEIESKLLSDALQSKNYFLIFSKEIVELQSINEKLWIIEDSIREKEKKKEFDNEFIELARSVYITNDIRFDIKNKINKMSDSAIVEEKSYSKY